MKTLNLFKPLLIVLVLLVGTSPAYAEGSKVHYGKEEVDGVNIFYRESGNPANQTVVLLHGFPHSSHQYRQVLAELGDDYHVIAPDYPAFGDSDFPSREKYTYTFENISESIDKFLIQRGIDNYVLGIQDYGAPIGFRIAVKHPEKVDGIIVMNGNTYVEGFNNETWEPIMTYWKNKDNPELEQNIIGSIFSDGGMQWQYTHGTRNPEGINPDNWNLDIMKFAREGQHRVHLDLFYDYQNNVKQYKVNQKYLRDNQPPMLIVWGKNDAFFPAPGAEAYKRDVKNIDFHLVDTGHFVLEEDGAFTIDKMREFLAKRVK